MTRKEKRQALTSKMSNLASTIKRLQSSIDSLLDLQEKNYLETRDKTLFQLLDLQAVLNRQYCNLVIESLNFDYMEV